MKLNRREIGFTYTSQNRKPSIGLLTMIDQSKEEKWLKLVKNLKWYVTNFIFNYFL